MKASLSDAITGFIYKDRECALGAATEGIHAKLVLVHTKTNLFTMHRVARRMF